MKVLIVGAGSVGASIAKELMMNSHDVTIIDSKPEAKKRADLPGVRWHIGDACARCTRTRRTWSLPQPVTTRQT